MLIEAFSRLVTQLPVKYPREVGARLVLTCRLPTDCTRRWFILLADVCHRFIRAHEFFIESLDSERVRPTSNDAHTHRRANALSLIVSDDLTRRNEQCVVLLEVQQHIS